MGLSRLGLSLWVTSSAELPVLGVVGLDSSSELSAMQMPAGVAGGGATWGLTKYPLERILHDLGKVMFLEFRRGLSVGLLPEI